MGGGLLQQVDRDILKSAMKCSAAVIGGVYRDAYKDPVTDPGTSSKRGRLALVRDEGGGHETVRLEGNEARDVLVPVFRDGEVLVDDGFVEVRARANAGLDGICA